MLLANELLLRLYYYFFSLSLVIYISLFYSNTIAWLFRYSDIFYTSFIFEELQVEYLFSIFISLWFLIIPWSFLSILFFSWSGLFKYEIFYLLKTLGELFVIFLSTAVTSILYLPSWAIVTLSLPSSSILLPNVTLWYLSVVHLLIFSSLFCFFWSQLALFGFFSPRKFLLGFLLALNYFSFSSVTLLLFLLLELYIFLNLLLNPPS